MLVILNSAREVVYVDRFHRIDRSLQVGRIKAACEWYNDCLVLVDSTGKGEPVYESLRRENVRARDYAFTARSKAQLVDNLALLLEQRKITLPRPKLWPEGTDEIETFQFTVTDSGHVKSGAPSGQHDDCAIALALAARLIQSLRSERELTGIGFTDVEVDSLIDGLSAGLWRPEVPVAAPELLRSNERPVSTRCPG